MARPIKDPETGGVEGEHYHYPPEVQPRADAVLQVWHLNGLSSEDLDLAARMLGQFEQRLPTTLGQDVRDAVLLECARTLFDRLIPR
jgi:hypothetical protein